LDRPAPPEERGASTPGCLLISKLSNIDRFLTCPAPTVSLFSVRLDMPPALRRPPTAPRDAIVTENSRSRVVLSWSPPEDPGGRTDIRYHVDCYGCGPVSSQSGIRFEPGQSLSDRSVAIRGLQPLTRYTFHVYALNGVSEVAGAERRAWRAVTVQTIASLPNKLDAVSARIVSPTSVQLSWTNPTPTSKSFELKIFPKKDHSRPLFHFTEKEQFLVKELEQGATYLVQIRARTNLGWGDYSDAIAINTLTPTKQTLGSGRVDDDKADSSSGQSGASISIIIGAVVAVLLCLIIVLSMIILMSRRGFLFSSRRRSAEEVPEIDDAISAFASRFAARREGTRKPPSLPPLLPERERERERERIRRQKIALIRVLPARISEPLIISSKPAVSFPSEFSVARRSKMMAEKQAADCSSGMLPYSNIGLAYQLTQQQQQLRSYSTTGSRANYSRMAEKGLTASAALPRVFSTGNFKEWLQRFNVCAKVNKWDTCKAERLATFLDGEALVVYLELSAGDQADYDKVVQALDDAFHPNREHFAVMEAFKSRKILSNETPRMYLYELKKMLKSSSVDNKDAQEALLFHQFVCGLPESVSWQIRADSSVKTSEQALQKAQLLMQHSSPSIPAAAVQPQSSQSSEVQELRDTVQSLQASATAARVQLHSVNKQPISIERQIELPLTVGGVTARQLFFVVSGLVCPVIVGVDFIGKHNLQLDFTGSSQEAGQVCSTRFQADTDDPVDIEDALVPEFSCEEFELPTTDDPDVQRLLVEFKDLFKKKPGLTHLQQHRIVLSDEVIQAMDKDAEIAPRWRAGPLQQLGRIWKKLKLDDDGVLLRKFNDPDGLREVPVVPARLRQQFLTNAHEGLGGHFGAEKCYRTLKLTAYWPGMAEDIVQHCQSCSVCQEKKAGSRTSAPLGELPIGSPWDSVAIDIVKVAPSSRGNKYLLVAQDQFSKYLTAVFTGRDPSLPVISQQSRRFYDVRTYADKLEGDLLRIREFVEEHLVQAAGEQKSGYDRSTGQLRMFSPGDEVLLRIELRGSKLAPYWEPGWQVLSQRDLVVEIQKIENGRTRRVNVNRLRPRILPVPDGERFLQPPFAHAAHGGDEADEEPPPRRYPVRRRMPVDRYVAG
uniref:Protein-tyrosine-phosphatase n=1 Tax=Macrostomum lignano TaxID=282301 RepID=A0A1I8IVY6_9PLAT